jgi:uncharacterized membrane protein YeaQ/YmgE (transglycosylase-associated protein family)
MESMMPYLVQTVVGAVIGYVGKYIPFLQNNQTMITNLVLGAVGSVGGNAAAGAAHVGDGSMLSTIGSGAVGSIAALLLGKLGKK